MQELKEIYRNSLQKPLKDTSHPHSQLVSFQCMICLNQFNDEDYQPILVCQNQHNMCKECVQKRIFKKSSLHEPLQIQEKYGEFCPLCNEEIDQKKLRKNNLLLEIYSWIQNISKRQNQKIHTIKKDFQQVQQEYKTILMKLNQKNEELLSCVDVLSRQNQRLKQTFHLKSAEKQTQIDEQNFIRLYETLISDLKERMHIRKIKALKAMTILNHNFEIDTLHKHFQKFKLQPNNCIEMQGPFYRSFFQGLNFYYNVMSSIGIRMEDFELNENLSIKYAYEIIQTKKGHFYIGFSSKSIAYEINPHSHKNFTGFCVQDCEILQKGKRIQTKLTKLRPKVYKGMVIEIEVKKQTTYWKVNQQVVFEGKTNELFDTESVLQIFPIVSMQMVGDKICIKKQN